MSNWQCVTEDSPPIHRPVIVRIDYSDMIGPGSGTCTSWVDVDRAERVRTPQGLIWLDDQGGPVEVDGVRVTGWQPWPEA